MPTKLPSPGRREDPHLGIRVHIVGTRQRRPNLPTTGCPFCPGGIEAPDPSEVRWFTNRWLAMEGDRCEVVLYTPANQRPTVPTGWDDAWFNIEIVSPWRAAGVQRFIAAAEVATGEFFNPVVPEELAERLRSV